MNIHASVGMSLTNAMRSTLAGHDFIIRRGSQDSEVFSASSPPFGHELLKQSGFAISEHERVFYWKLSDVLNKGTTDPFGKPATNDLLIDQKDNSVWKILPGSNSSSAWKYHGQDQTAVWVVAKKDS